MKSLFPKLQKRSTTPVAAFLVFWLSGVLFLFCCGTMQTLAADKEFCPIAAKGQSHCDKMKRDAGPTFSSVTAHLKFDCCGFLPAVFDKTRKIEKTEQAAQGAGKIKLDSPVFAFAENDFDPSPGYRPPVLQREKIFIKNCIFRI